MSESSRLCGYCRMGGHRKPDCPEFKSQRLICLTHTPKQRKALIDTLVANGLGIGAMIKGNSWDGEYVGLIDSFDWVKSANFVESTNVRYSKKVRLKELNLNWDFEYRSVHMRFLRMGGGHAEYRTKSVHFKNGKLVSNDWEMMVAAPSDTCEYDPDILVREIYMPTRLCKNKEERYERGVMPIQLIG